MAERSGADLRRPLLSAERFSERAIFLGGSLKTPFCRSRASLVCATRLDQYRPAARFGVRLRFAVRFGAMAASVPLEELHGPLVPLRGGERLEGAQVPPLARARILLARVEAELARLELPDHAANLLICSVARHRSRTWATAQ